MHWVSLTLLFTKSSSFMLFLSVPHLTSNFKTMKITTNSSIPKQAQLLLHVGYLHNFLRLSKTTDGVGTEMKPKSLQTQPFYLHTILSFSPVRLVQRTCSPFPSKLVTWRFYQPDRLYIHRSTPFPSEWRRCC